MLFHFPLQEFICFYDFCNILAPCCDEKAETFVTKMNETSLITNHLPPRAKHGKNDWTLSTKKEPSLHEFYVFAKNNGTNFGEGSFVVFVDATLISRPLTPRLAPMGQNTAE